MKSCSTFFLLACWVHVSSFTACCDNPVVSSVLSRFPLAWLPHYLGCPRGSINCDFVVSSVFLIIVKVGAMFFPAFHILTGSLCVLFLFTVFITFYSFGCSVPSLGVLCCIFSFAFLLLAQCQLASISQRRTVPRSSLCLHFAHSQVKCTSWH